MYVRNVSTILPTVKIVIRGSWLVEVVATSLKVGTQVPIVVDLAIEGDAELPSSVAIGRSLLVDRGSWDVIRMRSKSARSTGGADSR